MTKEEYKNYIKKLDENLKTIQIPKVKAPMTYNNKPVEYSALAKIIEDMAEVQNSWDTLMRHTANMKQDEGEEQYSDTDIFHDNMKEIATEQPSPEQKKAEAAVDFLSIIKNAFVKSPMETVMGSTFNKNRNTYGDLYYGNTDLDEISNKEVFDNERFDTR